MKSIIFVVIIFLHLSQLIAQSKQIPLNISIRKSFFGGSYVLQVKNDTSVTLALWVEAKEKRYEFVVEPGRTKDIGWAQGLRFDANDLFCISGNGFDTLCQTMPWDELSPLRISFSLNRGLVLNLSQSYVQRLVPQRVSLPIRRKYGSIMEVSVTEYPQIVLQDGSNKIFSKIVFHTRWFSSNIELPLNVTVSFVPQYEPSKGVLFGSQVNIDEMGMLLIPQETMNELRAIINQLVPDIYDRIEVFKLDKDYFRYARKYSVRKVLVRDGRIEIELL